MNVWPQSSGVGGSTASNVLYFSTVILERKILSVIRPI